MNSYWTGDVSRVRFDEPSQGEALLDLGSPCYAVRVGEQIGLTSSGEISPNGHPLLASVEPLHPSHLGDGSFQTAYGVRLSYASGSMAKGIASEQLVTTMAKARLMSSFGAAGLLPSRIADTVRRLKAELPDRTFACNLIHSPIEDALERGAVEVYLEHGVSVIEASAYLDLTPHVVRYRVAGLKALPDGAVHATNRVIAKVSRREVATKFMSSAPAKSLAELAAAGLITEQQARMAETVPMCDDLTVEADSGGHTDNRPLVCLLPSMLELRDELRAPVRIGAAGGISTPASALAAFSLGAAYVVVGSVNQSCREAGTSEHTKKLLAQAEMADTMMAPAADMFEMGVKVQLLKRGSLFGPRAAKLYDIYTTCDSLEAIPPVERERLEKQVFRRSLDDVWHDTRTYFQERDPAQLRQAEQHPKRKMALVFRWYLGLSSRWSNSGEPGREMDYQIWCGPAMGAFNDWVRGSYLESPEARSVVDVTNNIMEGAAYLYRLQHLQMQGFRVPLALRRFAPRAISRR